MSSFPLPQDPGALLDTPAAAAFLRLSTNTLIAWRHERRGPKYLKLGDRAVRYRLADLIAFAKEVGQ